MSEPLNKWWVRGHEFLYTPLQSLISEGSVAVYLAADVDPLLWQREQEVIALKLRVDQLGGFDKVANACEKATLESPKEELYSWTMFYMKKVTDIEAQLAAMTAARERLLKGCEAIAEEVIEYVNTPTPGGKPAEPGLDEAVRQMKSDLWQQLAAAQARCEQLEDGLRLLEDGYGPVAGYGIVTPVLKEYWASSNPEGLSFLRWQISRILTHSERPPA